MLQHFAGHRHAHFLDNTQNVALCRLGIRTHYEVRCGQGIEVGDMTVNKGG
jgi:hypothetical protein